MAISVSRAPSSVGQRPCRKAAPAARKARTAGGSARTSYLLVRVAPGITGELKSKIDRVWDSFWSGGISNPLEVIEHVTSLLFIRRLDNLQILAEKKARFNEGVIEDPVFLPGQSHCVGASSRTPRPR